MEYANELMGATILLPALLVVFHRTGRTFAEMAIWVLSPIAAYVIALSWESLSGQLTPGYLTDALLGFSILSAIFILPWLVLSLLGVFLGFVLRKLILRFTRWRAGRLVER